MEYGEVKKWSEWDQKGEPSLNQSDKSSPPAAWFWLFHWIGKKFRGNWSGSFLQDTLLRSPALLCYESPVVHDLLPGKKMHLPLFWRPIPAPSPSSWIILGGTGYLWRLVPSLHVGQQLQEGPHVVHRVVVGLQQPWGRWTDGPGPEEYMLICTSSIA